MTERFLVDLSTFDGAQVGLALCDGDGRFLEVSDGLAAILGREAADVVGWHCTEVVHPDDRGAAQALLLEFMAGGADQLRHEERLLRADGDVRWVAVFTSRIAKPGGTEACAILWVVDITARRHAEHERDRVAATLAEAQAIAHLGSWEYDLATHRTMFSEELFRIFGLDPSTSPPDITLLFQCMHVEDGKAVREAIRLSFENSAVFSVESRMNRADGAERLVHVQGRWSVGATGRKYLIGTVQDVTAQRRAEAKLRANDEHFHALFEKAPIGIAIVDEGLRMLEVNAAFARMIGEAHELLVGRTLVDITYSDDVERTRELGPTTLAGLVPGHAIEARLVRRDGSVVLVGVRATLLGQQAGEPRFCLVVLEDITRKQDADSTAGALDSARHELLGRLTAQERRILEYVTTGYTYRQIAEELTLAEKTVRNYASNLLAKLGMHSRSEAAAFAARMQERGSFGARS